tara:strand:- start:554 stop:1150 length:597 start_codon:yes stop_codon:yes gene_type:complete
MTPDTLREIYGNPSLKATEKVITVFDHHCRQFIKHATFVVLATSDGKNLDISPKGDPAGIAAVESDSTLLLPDRPGNKRLDGMMNILRHPYVAAIFFIPTVDETLRVNGRAEILDDEGLRARFEIAGRVPKTVLRITADEIYTHCGKAPMRAGLWKPETWPKSRPIPTLFEMLRDHTSLPIESTDQSDVEQVYRDGLY